MHKILSTFLLLENVKEEDNGTYQCKGININRIPFEAFAEVLVGGKFNDQIQANINN